MDLESILEQMRREAREDHLTLVKKVDTGFSTLETRADKIAENLTAHELKDLEVQGKVSERLLPLEQLNRTAKWLVGALITALISVGAAGLWKVFVR